MNKELYWKKALEQTQISISKHCLFPLSTKEITREIYADKDFIIRKLDSSRFKRNSKFGPKSNPFKPWDKILDIGKVGKYHQLILNKYPVQMGHILLITNSWKPQNGWLDINDWLAIKSVNEDTTGLWFFNSSPLAGASQPHRHIQLLRRDVFEINCPREEWFLNHKYKKNNKLRQNIILTEFNSLEHIDSVYKLYLTLSKELGLGDPEIDEKPKHPYNLLFTSKWLAIIKRANDNIHGFSINGLGFAGYILVTDLSNLKYLKEFGPEKLLENFV